MRQMYLSMAKAGSLAVTMALFPGHNVKAASFDCEKATTRVEKVICSDAELSKMDEELAGLCRTALNGEEQNILSRKMQKKWLNERNTCSDAVCIKKVYETRIKKLTTTISMHESTNANNSAQQKKEPFKFALTKGQGVPVCEAYLQRLNNTDFNNAPFCGRPEDDSVPGFTRLNRVPLSAERIYRLLPKIAGFESSQNQNYWKEEFMDITSVRKDMGMNRLGAWRYDPPVDIDNDGKPENIIIWNRGRFSCGSENYDSPYPAHSSYTANILDEQNQSIDEERTRELFGHPMGWLGIEYKGFRYIGRSTGVFSYQGIFYFDSFFEPSWGDYQGKRRKSAKLAETLAVFLRKDRKTEQICEYYWTNNPNLYPERSSR